MVSRLTPSVLAIPRCEIRSVRARSMSARFSSESRRCLGFRVNVLPQFLQRQRFVPLRFVPNGPTDSVSWQCGQGSEIMPRLNQIKQTQSSPLPNNNGCKVVHVTPPVLLQMPARSVPKKQKSVVLVKDDAFQTPGQGFEPQFSGPEPDVLPLHHPGILHDRTLLYHACFSLSRSTRLDREAGAALELGVHSIDLLRDSGSLSFSFCRS